MKKISKKKVKTFIIKAIFYLTIWALAVIGIYYTLSNCITVYN